jgi:hypothetical protein
LTSSLGVINPGVVIRLEDPSQESLTMTKGALAYSDSGTNFQELLLHEIGHALGLAVNADPNSAEYYLASTTYNGLDATDIAGIQALYGLAANHPASAAPTTTTANSALPIRAPDDTQVVHSFVQAMAAFPTTAGANLGQTLQAGADAGRLTFAVLGAGMHHPLAA